MPDLIRHPDVVPTKALHRMVYRAKVGNHLKNWVPVFTGDTGFLLEFTPMKIGAGMTAFYKNHNLWTDTN
jgi:hypothetical protein